MNRQPAWVANASDAAIGANSRVFTSDEMIPVAGPRPSRSRKLYPSMPTRAPTVMPKDDRHAGGTATYHQ